MVSGSTTLNLLPKISLVTPCFNHALFIERTIQSVLNQQYPKLEYIVIDGASSDGSVEVIQRFAPSLAYWVSERDSGQSEAINKGLQRATGDVIGWLNSDDSLAPKALWRIAAAYQRWPEIDLVYGHSCLIDTEDRVIKRLLAVPTNARELIRYNRNVWAQPGTTWRRRLQEKIGLLDNDLHYAMDNDYWIRAALAGKIHCIPYHLANLRVHTSTKSNLFSERFKREQQLIDARYGVEYHDAFHRITFRLTKMARALSTPQNYSYYFARSDPHG
jgi:glycosyltransferase involved in cell wall biosynthesis